MLNINQKSRIMVIILSAAALLFYNAGFITVDADTIGQLIEKKFSFGFGLLNQILPKITFHLSGWELISAAGLAGRVPGISDYTRTGAFLFWIFSGFCIVLLVTVAVSNAFFTDKGRRITVIAGVLASLIHTGIWGLFSIQELGLISPLAMELAVFAAFIPGLYEIIKKEEYRQVLQISGIVLGSFIVLLSCLGVLAVMPSIYSVIFYVFLFLTASCIFLWELMILQRNKVFPEYIKILGVFLPIVLFAASCIFLAMAAADLGKGWLGVMICDLAMVCTGFLEVHKVSVKCETNSPGLRI